LAIGITLQVSVLAIAILATSVLDAFALVGGIAAPAIAFLYPGLGYLVALYRFGPKSSSGKIDTILCAITAIVLILCFCIAVALTIYLEASGSRGSVAV